MVNKIDFLHKAGLAGAEQYVLEKWNKLLHRAMLFTHIPFIEAIFVAGSMAIGNTSKDSDFDLIIAVKSGRIFTARAFCVFMFGVLGWRRKRGERGASLSDKFCLNHFVTPEKYKLSGPYSESWQKLYSSLVPIYGNKDMIQKFYDANSDWMKEKRIYKEDKRHIYRKGSKFKLFLEIIFERNLGIFLEKFLKDIQIKKIEKSLRTEKLHNPRIIFNDSELEFHPDRKKFEL